MRSPAEIRSSLVSRFPAGHEVFRCFDDGLFTEAAQFVREKYDYIHPLTAEIEGLAEPPEQDAAVEIAEDKAAESAATTAGPATEAPATPKEDPVTKPHSRRVKGHKR